MCFVRRGVLEMFEDRVKLINSNNKFINTSPLYPLLELININLFHQSVAKGLPRLITTKEDPEIAPYPEVQVQLCVQGLVDSYLVQVLEIVRLFLHEVLLFALDLRVLVSQLLVLLRNRYFYCELSVRTLTEAIFLIVCCE